MKKFYRLVLGRALWISWRYKWLWPLGLAAIFVSAGSVYDFLLRMLDNFVSGRTPFYSLGEYWSTNLFSWLGLFEGVKVAFVGGLNLSAVFWAVVSIICLLVILVLAIVCHVALIKSAMALDRGKKITPNQAIHGGTKLFWPALKFNILSKVVLFALIVAFSWLVSLVVLDNSLLMLAIYAAAFVVLVIATIIVHFITVYGIASLVLKKTNVIHAVRNAFRLFWKNVVLNLEMGLILFFVNVAVGFAGMIALIVVESPLIMGYMLSSLMSWNLLALLFSFLMLIVFTIGVLVVVGWLSTFHISSWTILFDELEANRGTAKVSRLAKHLMLRLKK